MFSFQYQKQAKLGYTFLVTKSHNELEGLKEVLTHFKINVKRCNVFSRCMVCNCDEFLIASKVQMIKLKYDKNVPDDLMAFLKEHEKYSGIVLNENKHFWNWQPFKGAKRTSYGGRIESLPPDGTLKAFQTFYICEKCAKVYWDGGHYHQNCGGRLDHIFNLFPEADNKN